MAHGFNGVNMESCAISFSGGLVMSISTLQNINYLISDTNSITNKSAPQVKEDTDVTSFSEILSAACWNRTDVSGMFQSVLR